MLTRCFHIPYHAVSIQFECEFLQAYTITRCYFDFSLMSVPSNSPKTRYGTATPAWTPGRSEILLTQAFKLGHSSKVGIIAHS